MILLFHSLFIMGRIVYHVICDKLFGNRYYINNIYVQLEPRDYTHKSYLLAKRYVKDLKALGLPKTGDLVCKFDENSGLKFFPPVYAQRYNAIKEVMTSEIWRGKLKKVLDAGCGELNFFPFLKNTPGIEEVLALDIDSELLESVSHRVGPLLVDHLSMRSTPFSVKVLAGSIAKPDPCLMGCDAVIAIELIEHLYPNDLEEVPFTIFGFIHPSVALITTPNGDFNVLFGQMHGFRHPDHKFEWSRVQFQDWAMNIVQRYPDYEVTFKGIGKGPIGSEHFGCCSQMAVFTRRNIQDVAIENGEVLTSNNDRILDLAESLQYQENYEVIAEYEYPVYVDNRSDKQKMQSSANCFISNAATKVTLERQIFYERCEENGYYPDEEYDEDIYIYLEEISSALHEWNLTEDQIRELLKESGWVVENHKEKLAVNYSLYEDQDRNSSFGEEEEIDEKEHSTSEKVEVDFEWDCNDKEEDWCPVAQNLSPEPSCESDWNEDDTQTRANVDSGYPNSYSAQDKDFANSVDLHGSSLEEDSEDDMEEDLANAFVPADRLQGLQPLPNENMNNINHLNAAPMHDLFYEVEGNQDENQDVVNNNCDNEGNNAEAVFGVDDEIAHGINIEDGSDSEAEVPDVQSEDESDGEAEQAAFEDEEELMERLLQQVQLPQRQSVPHREVDGAPGNWVTDHPHPAIVAVNEQDAAGDAWQNLPIAAPVDPDQDEGFAEVLAGPAIAVAPVDEGGAGEPSPF
ncbi:small RNA 2'-O-methyltransferase [Hetaerina americana]|uniref:small RNA 2'-O-methyltransferase n=1 Tax=Hetaerina americana TaxID=62018 RepID=UPI003A7F5C8D